MEPKRHLRASAFRCSTKCCYWHVCKVALTAILLMQSHIFGSNVGVCVPQFFAGVFSKAVSLLVLGTLCAQGLYYSREETSLLDSSDKNNITDNCIVVLGMLRGHPNNCKSVPAFFRFLSRHLCRCLSANA